jgi:hypothetical protein
VAKHNLPPVAPSPVVPAGTIPGVSPTPLAAASDEKPVFAVVAVGCTQYKVAKVTRA